MDRFERHRAQHRLNRSGWVRAAVLGANDGILSTASIVSGVAAGGAAHSAIVLAGIAGLAAGAFSMAAGEYVSVSSQADIATADLQQEKHDLIANPKFEYDELTDIYVKRGLKPELAREVASQLTDHDALGAHARDELGISDMAVARPLQAAISSATSFTLGAAVPLAITAGAPVKIIGWAVFCGSLAALGILGFIAAKLSGAHALKPVLRVVLWGALSMGLTAAVGAVTGSVM